jgi:hypothetical protein
MVIKGGGIREDMMEQYKNIGSSDARSESRLLSLDRIRKNARIEQSDVRRGIRPSILSKSEIKELCIFLYNFAIEFPYVAELNQLYVYFNVGKFIRATYILLAGLNKALNRRIEIEYVFINEPLNPEASERGIPGYVLANLYDEIIKYIGNNILPEPYTENDTMEETINAHLINVCNYRIVGASRVVDSINYLINHNKDLKMNHRFYRSDFNYNNDIYLKVKIYTPDNPTLCGIFTNLPGDIDILYPINNLSYFIPMENPFALDAKKNCFDFMYNIFTNKLYKKESYNTAKKDIIKKYSKIFII